MKPITTLALTGYLLATSFFVSSQSLPLNTNNNGIPRLLSDSWNFGITSGASFGLNSNEKTLFRGNSLATKMFGRYNFGKIGLGLSSGFVPGSISDNALNDFLTERKLTRDQVQIQSAKPFNGYIAFGPGFRLGNRVQLAADVQGGLFLNNPGGLSITQLGASRATYRFDGGSKNFYPGFTGSINIIYPLTTGTHFFLSTDYLQSKSSIRLLDLARGIDVPVEQTRDIKLLTVGAGITKSFGVGNALNTRKKHIAGVKYQDFIIPRESGSGQASGKRILPTVNKKEIFINENVIVRDELPVTDRIIPTTLSHAINTKGTGAQTGRLMKENCGPVTIKTTQSDGTVSEMIFSCPEDAANYQKRTIGKQTQGATFGERVNQGLQSAGNALANGVGKLQSSNIIHRDLAARNILMGQVTWSGVNPLGVVTNKTANISSLNNPGGGASSASYARNGVSTNSSDGNNNKQGIITNIYTREAGSGMASGKRSREKGSGMATGRRQYQPLYIENFDANTDTNLGTIKSNPLYNDNGMSGTNPLFEGKDNLRTGGDNDCDGVADLTVYLIDADNGNTVATTQTESCGEFFFANVPTGNYIVKIAGTVLAKKGYDAFIKNKMDLAGEILSADDYWAVELTTDTGSVEQAIIKTKTKSNQSNDRVASSQQNNTGMVWSPRSNIKILPLKTGDVDGDGIPETLVGNNNSGAYEVMRGAPLKGVGVSLGKIPGGGVANKTVQTNEYGEFEFTDLEPGNYTLTADLHYTINDETYLSVGNNIVTSESNLKGEPKITASQNSQSLKTGINNGMPNRISMNLTVPKQTQGSTFGERVNAGLLSNNNNQLGAQNNNTVRSNRTDNAVIVADMDGDGAMESSYLNFNGEIATLTLFEGGVQASQNANATGGINILEDNTSNSKVVEKATSGLKDVVKTQVRMAGNTGLNKWVAPELLNKKLQGNPQIDEATSTLILGNASMDKVEKGKWQIAPVSLKSIPCANGACVAITANGADYPSASNVPISSLLTIGQPVAKASFIFTDNSGKIYKKETDASGRLSFAGLPTGTPLTLLGNFGVDGNDDILLLFTTDAQGKPSCNVLKTKHDTVKNSIQNVR